MIWMLTKIFMLQIFECRSSTLAFTVLNAIYFLAFVDRHILMYKDGPSTERIKTFIVAVYP